jgi:hypothetical protein
MALGLGGVLLVGSCASGKMSAANAGVRLLPTRDPIGVLDAAETALVREGFVVDRRDVSVGVMTCSSPEEAADDAPKRRLRFSARSRRIAEIRVDPRGDRVMFSCRIVWQEQTTEAHRLLAYERSGSDLPSETPINRGAYATSEQRTVWRTLRRDRSAEREILEAVAERVGLALPPS